MDVLVTLTDAEVAYLEAEVARLVATGDTDLTVAGYLRRRLTKVIGSEVAQQRGERRARNVVEVVRALEALPGNDLPAALAPLGLTVTPDGRIVATTP